MSSESSNNDQSNLSTALVNASAPACIKSIIVNTPHALLSVENFLAIVSTNGRNFIISSSRV